MKNRPHMREPICYRLNHTRGTVDLRVTDKRLIVITEGNRLLDRPHTVDIALSDLKFFGLVPTIAVQNIISRSGVGTSGDYAYDLSYDSEFIFSYHDRGKLKKKRVFVDSQDEGFQRLLADLVSRRPDASLLHLDPVVAQKQIGVMRAINVVYLIIGILVGGPIVVALGVLIYFVLTGFR